MELGALFAARLDVAEHALELRPVDDCTHARVGIERIAGLDRPRNAHHTLEEVVLQ